MHYRIVTDRSNNHGLILGRHNTYGGALDKITADKLKYGVLGALIAESEISLKAKTIDTQLADRTLIEQRTAAGILLMSELLDAQETGKVSEFLISRIHEHGWTKDTLTAEMRQVTLKHREQKAARSQQAAESRARRAAEQAEITEAAARFCFTFPAVAGTQAGKQYFTAQIPFNALVRLFRFNDSQVPVELRAQRQLNEPRAKKIGEYISSNTDTYVLPAITASCDSAMRFEAIDSTAGQLGMLHIPMESTLLINDGQHRRRGIEHALQGKDPDLLYQLKSETIAVTIYYDQGLSRSQQIFADINKTPAKPSAAITALYDHRDPVNRWVLELLEKAPLWKARIELEKTSIGKTSDQLYSIIAIKKFALTLLGKTERTFAESTDEHRAQYQQTVTDFLTGLLDHLPAMARILEPLHSAADARDSLVIAHAAFLQALAVAGRHLIQHQLSHNGVNLDTGTEPLSNLDTRRTAPCWDGTCLVNGRLCKTAAGINSTAVMLCKTLGIGVPTELKKWEVV